MSWKIVKLGELLNESRIPCENPNPDRRIKVKLKVLGVEKRGIETEIEGATKQFIRKAGQFIYGKQNFHKGAFGIIPQELDGYESSADLPAFDVSEKCLPEWIFYFFKQGNYYLELSKIARGVATQRIHPEQIYDLEIPLPDIKTQKEFLSKINSLENNGDELKSELTHQLTLVKKLRQQLLQDAVQGKLVEQIKKEEPASDLLRKIKDEKQKLIAEKVIKQGKLQEAEKQEDLLFNIPNNWVWCKLDELCRNITDGTHQTPTYTQDGIPFISAQHVKPFKFTPDNRKYVSYEAYLECTKNKKPEIGDILITRVGAIGEAAVIDIKMDFAFYVSLGLIQPLINLVNSRYIELVINSPYGNSYSKGNVSSKGSSAGNYNLGRLRSFQIPLPPPTEQNRIIQKLDELMQYCNELEASIKESESQNEKLLQQVLREALRPAPKNSNKKSAAV